jgi:hypothetical protein
VRRRPAHPLHCAALQDFVWRCLQGVIGSADPHLRQRDGYVPMHRACFSRGNKATAASVVKVRCFPPHSRTLALSTRLHRCTKYPNRKSENGATATQQVNAICDRKAFYEFGFDINTLALEENDDGPIDNDFPLGTCRDMAVSRGQQHVLDYLDRSVGSVKIFPK